MVLGTFRARAAIVLMVTAIKMALAPGYLSTDFEVHRNWLAITGSLPLSQWYTEARSQWTLDYPPLFAYFEYFLSLIGGRIDPGMLQVGNSDYASPATILFQRSTVIWTDLVLISGTGYAVRHLPPAAGTAVFFLVVANSGLIIVDHIHFQYNGLLLGLLIWSIALMREGHSLAAAAVFAVLVNMKHLFLCLAPLYLIYLLSKECRGRRGLVSFLQLGIIVLGICGLSFGPFIERGQLWQVLGRMFPFQRGLLHAYWAPNVWALYAAADKFAARATGDYSVAAANTGGKVQEASFLVLPTITPLISLGLVLVAQAPVLAFMARSPRPELFPRAVVHGCLCSFLLGFHVHEKAILMVLVPLALNAADGTWAAGEYLFTSVVATYSLFPLLYTSAEYPIKVTLLVAYYLLAGALLQWVLASSAGQQMAWQLPAPEAERIVEAKRAEELAALQAAQQQAQQPGAGSSAQHGAADVSEPGSQPEQAPRQRAPRRLIQISFVANAYLLGLIPLELYASWLHPAMDAGNNLPFLPRLLISAYCALGVCGLFFWVDWPFATQHNQEVQAKPKTA